MFYKYYGDFTDFEAKFFHYRFVDENIVRLEEHPVIKVNFPGALFNLEIESVLPVEHTSIRLTLSYADYVSSSAVVQVIVYFSYYPGSL